MQVKVNQNIVGRNGTIQKGALLDVVAFDGTNFTVNDPNAPGEVIQLHKEAVTLIQAVKDVIQALKILGTHIGQIWRRWFPKK